MIACNAELSQLSEITRPQFAIILWRRCNYTLRLLQALKKHFAITHCVCNKMDN